MKLITLYIPIQDSARFYQFLKQESCQFAMDCYYLFADEKDLLYICDYNEWATELSYADVIDKQNKIW